MMRMAGASENRCRLFTRRATLTLLQRPALWCGWAVAVLLAVGYCSESATAMQGYGKYDEGGGAVTTPYLDSLKIGGRLRVRGEARSPHNYALDQSTDVMLQRTRLYFDAGVNDNLGIFLEIQDSRVWGEELSSVGDVEGLDLHQGYILFREVMHWPVDIKLGRMQIEALGDQRLISHLDWDNVGRAWDGAYVTYTPAHWKVNGMWMNMADGVGVESNDEYLFEGVYASYRGVEKHEIDAYLFYRDNGGGIEAVTGVAGPLDNRQDVTLGVRVKGAVLEDFQYTGEFALQFGRQGGAAAVGDALDVGAWFAAVSGWYTFSDMRWTPKVQAEFVLASGDDDAGDGDIGTFDPLFTFGHYYHGHMDLVLPKNLRAFKLGASVKPLENWSFHLDNHMFFRMEEEDAWYGVGFSRPAAGSDASYIGHEIDLFAKGRIYERAWIWAGYSHFTAGDFVEESGFDGDADFLFAQIEVKF